LSRRYRRAKGLFVANAIETPQATLFLRAGNVPGFERPESGAFVDLQERGDLARAPVKNHLAGVMDMGERAPVFALIAAAYRQIVSI
jgi:hypothetical protein